MRKFFVALLILIHLGVFSQNATVKGKIQGRPHQRVDFVYAENPIGGYYKVGTIITDSNGIFSFHFPLTEKKPVRLTYNASKDENNPDIYMFSLWMEPGKTLSIAVKNDTAIKYAGGCAAENNLLKRLGLNSYFPSVQYDTTQFNFIALRDSLNSVRENKLALMKKETQQRSFSPGFTTFVKAEIFHQNFQDMLLYLEVYADAKNINEIKAPNEFDQFLNTIQFFNDDAFYSLKYRNSLWKYFNYISTRDIKGTTKNYLPYTFRLIDQKLLHHPRTREFVKAYIMKFVFNFEQNIDSLQASLASFETEFPQSRTLPYFQKKMSEKIGLLYAKKTLPDVELTDTLGRKISLQDLKGKILLIDFWGSWCIPCIEQMPYSIKLEEELNSDEVLFVYINNPIDGIERWLSTIRKLGIKGLQLKADEKAIKQLHDFYVFTSYPFYVITDVNGKPQNIEGGIGLSTNAKQIIEGLLKKGSAN